MRTALSFTPLGADVNIMYLVLKSTRFLRCVLYPGESLHVFCAVLTRLQVRLDDALSDALCETRPARQICQCCVSRFALWERECSRVTAEWHCLHITYRCSVNYYMRRTTLMLLGLPLTDRRANGSFSHLISMAVMAFSTSCT